MSEDKPLTKQRVKFCQSYVSNGCIGAKAARSAGYADGSAKEEAARLLTIPNVREYIEELTASAAKEAQLTAEWLINETMENLESAKHDKKYSDVNKSAELLGKYLAIWTEKSEQNVNVTGVTFNRKPTAPESD